MSIVENLDHSLLIAQLHELSASLYEDGQRHEADLALEAAVRLDAANRQLDTLAVKAEATCRALNWDINMTRRALHGGIRIGRHNENA